YEPDGLVKVFFGAHAIGASRDVRPDVAYDQIDALGRQREGVRAALTARAAGDQRDLARQIPHSVALSVQRSADPVRRSIGRIRTQLRYHIFSDADRPGARCATEEERA